MIQTVFVKNRLCSNCRVCTGPGNPWKSLNFLKLFSRPEKSWNSNAGPGKSWKSELGYIFIRKLNALKFLPNRIWLNLSMQIPKFLYIKCYPVNFPLCHRPEWSLCWKLHLKITCCFLKIGCRFVIFGPGKLRKSP